MSDKTTVYIANWTTAQVSPVEREMTDAFREIMKRSAEDTTLTHAYFPTKEEALEYNLQKALRNVENKSADHQKAQELLLKARSAIADRGEVN